MKCDFCKKEIIEILKEDKKGMLESAERKKIMCYNCRHKIKLKK